MLLIPFEVKCNGAAVFDGARTKIRHITFLHERQAIRLLVARGLSRGLRTLDAPPLSVALDLRERGHLDYFVCADATLCNVVQLEGLPVINPETP